MPLRDHFRPPLDNVRSWEELHGGWPMMLVAICPGDCRPATWPNRASTSGPTSRLMWPPTKRTCPPPSHRKQRAEEGGVATAVWAPPQPTLAVTTNLLDQDEYEVRVYDTKRHRRLVAAVEIVSPANKDRPETRRVFVAKCRRLAPAARLGRDRRSGHDAPVQPVRRPAGPDRPGRPIPDAGAAGAVRRRLPLEARSGCLAPGAWTHALAIGQPLPTLPLWLADNLAVPLELEASYEETCRILRIP